jgi:predicted secreted protein
MAVINGTTMLLLLDGVAIGCTRSATLNINNDTYDASCKSSNGWADNGLGQRSWDVAFDGLYDPSGVANFEALFDELYERDATLIMEFAQIDGTGGGEVYRGNCLVTSLSLTADMEQPVTYSGTLTGTGSLYKSTVATS